MNLTEYNWIVLNSSAGKDSQAMTDYVVTLAAAQGCLSRVVMVHCDLGRVEWAGTKELAQEHANHYGIRFEIVRREGDLLTQIEARGMFPDNQNRYCTSDQKRDQVSKLFTRLVSELSIGPVKILNCMGIRAQESPTRAKRKPFGRDLRATNGKRTVDQWLPIFDWKLEQVWERIRGSGVRYHYAYDLGMPRLSCCFCIFAPKPALMLAGRHNPQLLAEYVRVEEKIGHTLRHKQSLKNIQDELDRGSQIEPVTDWAM